MLVAEYDEFVRRTDQFTDRPPHEREDIAIYGLVGEIGSVVAAVKKELLREAGGESWNFASAEIREELGDVMWYCFSLAQVINGRTPVNVLTQDIASLRREIGANNKRAGIIRATLDPAARKEFLNASAGFPQTKDMRFNDYQVLAFKTARTEGKVLLEVCLTVLWQLGAELLRRSLPEIELQLNTNVVDRKVNTILGEIAWHLSALAQLYNISLDDVASTNVEKVSFRMHRGEPTPLHDNDAPADQRLPRQFEVAFVTVGRGRTRMYLGGRQLGDELTDNYYEDDGYRFHDVLHLANAAKLGWSPVLRSLLGRKRKHNRPVDEVEDGARARIVEEAIVKIAHSEGGRLARQGGNAAKGACPALFQSRQDITFRFLRQIHTFASGLEVEKNRYWEWEDAIIEGHRIFAQLCQEEGGTVTVDLDARTISYRPEVYLDITGAVAGMGSSVVSNLTAPGSSRARATRLSAVKRAVLQALSMDETSPSLQRMLDITEHGLGRIAVKARGKVRKQMWTLGAITFKISVVEHSGLTSCTALAIADAKDAIR
ncbi:MAG: hypothetical protein JWM33_256 [Caulobacteraceae bacterium]|nr:hypothetical protein [Caulobacteraceae bacterium]